MIFSRNRGNAARRSTADPLKPGRHTRGRKLAEDRDSGGPGAAGRDAAGRNTDELDDGVGFDDDDRTSGFGPYDLADAPEGDIERLDLGALHIPAVPGVEIRLQAGPQGEITGLVLIHGASQLQLGAFAAPRTEGIWDEIREMIWSSLVGAGAKPEEAPGDYGTEIRARVRDESGATTIVRHIGVDGPRWFVHAVYYGAAAADPDSAGPLGQVLRGLVVNRGAEARPVKETLPMKLPAQAQQQLAEAAGAAHASDSVSSQSGSTASGSAGSGSSSPESAVMPAAKPTERRTNGSAPKSASARRKA